VRIKYALASAAAVILLGAPPAFGAGPVVVRRATRYVVQVSNHGRSWRTLATVKRSGGTTDTLRVRSGPVRFVRLRILAATRREMPLLQELTVR
jgi:hypothetical protein